MRREQVQGRSSAWAAATIDSDAANGILSVTILYQAKVSRRQNAPFPNLIRNRNIAPPCEMRSERSGGPSGRRCRASPRARTPRRSTRCGWRPGKEPVDDPRVIAIGEAAAELDSLRRNWLDPEGASEAELKKRTLTNLYNQRPTWLQHAHATLDRAVWAAYSWDDPDPASVPEDTILSRLLALNLERAG